MNPEAVLFDLDDTLHDRQASILEFAPRLFAHLEPILNGVTFKTFKSAFLKCDGGGYMPRDIAMRTLLESLGVNGDPEAIAAFWHQHFAASSAQLMPGAFQSLRTLRARGIKTGIVTNGKTVLQNRKIEALQLRPKVDVIVISEEVGFKKPNASVFQFALHQLQVAPEQTWFVGDHPVNDICGAVNVGLRAFWLERQQPWNTETIPHTGLETLAELMTHLELN